MWQQICSAQNTRNQNATGFGLRILLKLILLGKQTSKTVVTSNTVLQSTFPSPYAVKTVLAVIYGTDTRSKYDLRNGTSDRTKICSPCRSADIRAILWL